MNKVHSNEINQQSVNEQRSRLNVSQSQELWEQGKAPESAKTTAKHDCEVCKKNLASKTNLTNHIVKVLTVQVLIMYCFEVHNIFFHLEQC